MFAEVALASAIALLALASHADAHGHLYEPEPTFMDGKPTVEWVVQIDNYWDGVGSGGDQVGIFKTMAEEKGVTVRDVVLEMVGDATCGYTRTDVDPKDVPTDGKAIWWGNGGGGFTHQTPATETPATEAPATETPATEAPATEAPATEAAETEPPETEAEAETTEAPSTSCHFARLFAVTVLAFAALVDAHGHLYEPEPTFMDGKSTVEWVAQIDYYWEEVGSGGDQVGIFKTMAEEKNMTVRDVLLEMAPDYPCGYTVTDGDPKEIPTDGLAIWLGNDGGGFTHVGPCEIWLDDTMVLHGDNCEDEYPGGANDSGIMSEMPVDYSSCNGDCTLAIYWLGFQNEQWQAYSKLFGSILWNLLVLALTYSYSCLSGCIRLRLSETSVAGDASSESESESETEAPATEVPATETPATEAPSTEAPSTEAATTDAPAAEADATEAPTTSCNRRRRH
ncbi:hypothetical protein BBJ28_00007416 [Nothophytophthora sp. Chile5]|nr:hypothetical protein BBJ28_00007416 [Nothophytophthora sp. Chile5]